MIAKFYVCDRQILRCSRKSVCGTDCWITTDKAHAIPGLQTFDWGRGMESRIIAGIMAESYAQGYWAGKAAKDEP